MKADDKENVLTKALGVLAENGLYALAVHLLSCQKKAYGRAVLEKGLFQLWQEVGIVASLPSDSDIQTMLETVRGICESLPRLIMAKRLAERMLTFARYHTKALGGK